MKTPWTVYVRSYMTQPRFLKILLCYVRIWRWNRSIFNSDFHVFGHGIDTYLSFSLYKNECKPLKYQKFRAARQTKEKYPKRGSKKVISKWKPTEQCMYVHIWKKNLIPPKTLKNELYFISIFLHFFTTFL